MLAEAIENTNARTGGYAAYYLINCAHPTHFEHVLTHGGYHLDSKTIGHVHFDEPEDFIYMSVKRFLALCALIFLFALLWNSFVHGIVLREAEAALASFARPTAERSLVLALAFGITMMFVVSHAWLVRSTGIAHWAYIGVLAGMLVDLNKYLVYPLSAGLAASWNIGGLIELSLHGLIAAWFCPVSDSRIPELSRR